MNRHVNAIAGRLSLRPPQRRSLEILDRVTQLVPPRKTVDMVAALAAIKGEFPSVTDFEREFVSLCFALATGVGKTRLMGAFVAYLHLAHGIDNFFVLAPNLTIYNKLITDFTPNTRKYVFKGIAEFAVSPPTVITGDNYAQRDPASGALFGGVRINIFNISKINSEVRGGRAPKIKRLSEYIGQSYFDYLASLPDLVLLMDESHRYRASAGVRAINELKPILGLELTATPQVETGKEPVRFNNVIYDYPLGQAMNDGFVKEPAVVTRKDFNAKSMSASELERMKLEDGIRLHESVKVELETYARETEQRIVKPFLLVIARDTTHARSLLEMIAADGFFDGRYKDKVIQVDSSQTGAKEEAMIERLLKVEDADEPTEIVIHVNMLKEGWDVTNLYTIVPLRAAHARTLIEQSIGRGLRLPYGKRTGVVAVDRLNIVAHDKFQEIVDEANRADSPIRLRMHFIDPQQLAKRTVTLVSQPILARKLGLLPRAMTASTVLADAGIEPAFTDPAEQHVAQVAYDIIRDLARRPKELPTLGYLRRADVQARIVSAVEQQCTPAQMQLAGMETKADVAAVVGKEIDLVLEQTSDIPRILVVPRGKVTLGFKPVTLDLSALKYPPVSEDLWLQHLRTGQRDVLALSSGGAQEKRLEDYVVSGLVDFDDVSYDDNAELLYQLAGQVIEHFNGYLAEDEVPKVLRCYQKEIAKLAHAQMVANDFVQADGYDVVIARGFTELKRSAYTKAVNEEPADYRVAPIDKSNMGQYVFGGFMRCLYEVQKFDSDSERVLAVILERDALKWFRPAADQFHLLYRDGIEQKEYQPDFVAETNDTIYMLEPKRNTQMTDPLVLAKKAVAEQWCARASQHAGEHGGKPWRYVLIPHDAIADNMTLTGLVERFADHVEIQSPA